MAARLDSLIGPEVALDGSGKSSTDDVVVLALTADSRAVTPGTLFAAMPGTKVDGAAFVPDAIARGAVAILAAEEAELPPDMPVPVLRAAEPRLALAHIAARFYGPGPDTVVAVTGTSGKTSVAEFTRQILEGLGLQAASVGTLGVITSSGAAYGSLTTPDQITLAATLADLRRRGITHVAMEASSHGLDQRRLDGVPLSAAAFTNLGRDHLDYHPTMDDYLAAKLGLFERLLAAGLTAVINADGDRAADVAAVAARTGHPVLWTGRNVPDRASGVRLNRVERDGFRQRLRLAVSTGEVEIVLPLPGAYQVENALVAAGLAMALEAPEREVLAALEGLRGVPGRLDVAGELRLGADRALAVVDYAHKPEALAACLDALRPFASGRLVCVMGCGGDRDRGKRPIMGRIAAEKADVVVVTDDNPRTEQPATIRAEVLAGIAAASVTEAAGRPNASISEIGDRGEAIRAAVGMLASGDVLVVAGKGHETGQIVGATVLPFSDHDAIAEAIGAREAAARASTGDIASTVDVASPAADAGGPTPLWTVDDAITATGAMADGIETRAIGGVSIDTRTLQPGDLFVALADVRDGHEFVPAAFKAGAAAALVRETYDRQRGDGLLLRVRDPLRALEELGRAARTRLAAYARVIAVTGSAGKTTTKEMLRLALSQVGPTHASEKSYNNHWGVPLTLARMPADTRFGVFEIGMNHAGEITPLSQMVRPNVAIVTTVEAVHIEHFADGVPGIARAKAEIFAGLEAPEIAESGTGEARTAEAGGVAVIPSDNAHAGILRTAAVAAGAAVVPFSLATPGPAEAMPTAGVHLVDAGEEPDATRIVARQLDDGSTHDLTLGLPGRHNLSNALAVVAALAAVLPAAYVRRATAALATMTPPPGRGHRTRLGTDGAILLIDESYNANPASMRAALATMAGIPRERFGRRIAVLGDMLELGTDAAALHAGLADGLADTGVDLLLASGPNMAHLHGAVPEARRGGWAETSVDLEPILLATVRPGDVVMIKGSNGSKMGRLVEALKARHQTAAEGQQT